MKDYSLKNKLAYVKVVYEGEALDVGALDYIDLSLIEKFSILIIEYTIPAKSFFETKIEFNNYSILVVGRLMSNMRKVAVKKDYVVCMDEHEQN